MIILITTITTEEDIDHLFTLLESVQNVVKEVILGVSANVNTRKITIQSNAVELLKKISINYLKIDVSEFELKRHVLESAKTKITNPKETYFLFMDLGERLDLFPTKFDVEVPAYSILTRCGDYSYYSTVLCRADQDWNWDSNSDHLVCSTEIKAEVLGEALIQKTPVQSKEKANERKSRMKKLYMDMKERKADPLELNHLMFYLAGAYHDAGDYEKALKLYLRRSQLDKSQEAYESAINAVKLQQFRGVDYSESIARAFSIDPERLEAYYFYSMNLRNQGQADIAWNRLKEKFSEKIPDPPSNGILVDESIYSWRFFAEAGTCAYYAGDKISYRRLYERAIASEEIPESDRAQLRQDLENFK